MICLSITFYYIIPNVQYTIFNGTGETGVCWKMYCMHFVGDFCHILCDEMDLDSAMNADNKEHLQAEETDDCCKVDFSDIVPLTRDTNSSCRTECVSGDWLGEVKVVDLADLKQESDDVCCVFLFLFI